MRKASSKDWEKSLPLDEIIEWLREYSEKHFNDSMPHSARLLREAANRLEELGIEGEPPDDDEAP